jgi:hypothetical protein
MKGETIVDSSALSDLLDRANDVFWLAGKLGRDFHDEHQQPRYIDPPGWKQHAPTLNEFFEAVLNLREEMQNPPKGFAPVAERLLEAARIARALRNSVTSRGGFNAHLDLFPELNTVSRGGMDSVNEVRRTLRLDDPFAFVDDLVADTESTDFIERLLAGPDEVELTPRELALLEGHMQQKDTSSTVQPSNQATGESESNANLNKLKLIREFNNRLQAAARPISSADENSHSEAGITAQPTDDQPELANYTVDAPEAVAESATKSVILFGRDGGPVVKGSEKSKLTNSQYDVVLALLRTGEKGLTKDELDRKSGHGDARKILKRLSERDSDWASVISFPGTTGMGYRIC